MDYKYKKINYKSLDSRQKEAFNLQRVSGVLAEYGFVTIRLTSDWGGADFIAQHKDGLTLKVQLKGRLVFRKKYMGKDLYVCFPDGDQWYIYPHDILLKKVSAGRAVVRTDSWKIRGSYSFPTLSEKYRKLLEPYRVKE